MRHLSQTILSVVSLAGVLATGAAHAQSCMQPAIPLPAYPPPRIAPVVVRALQHSVIVVPGTDGWYHLAYAMLAINAAQGAAGIGSIVPVDPLDGFLPTGTNAVIDVDGRPITGTVRLFDPSAATPSRPDTPTGLLDDPGEAPKPPQDFAAMPGGSAGIVFFDLTYARAVDVPRLLSHRVTVRLPGGQQPSTTVTDPIPVSCATPVVLSPPLVGYGWWNANGCCGLVSPHRSATLPINGDIRLPEQFAIDFEQIDAGHRCCTGPVKELASWPFYGAPVYAAAAGRVVEMVNDQPQQVPGPPRGVTIQNALGNNIVEDIGGGRFILYAHFATGSIPASISAGTLLTAGQQIGQVGNSGSSTAPHLHFQVMDRPSALDATGLPFVFDRQLVQGRVLGTFSETEARYESGQAVQTDPTGSGWQTDRMPVEDQIFAFHTQ